MGNVSDAAKRIGISNPVTDIAGQFEDIYKLGDQYGGEFWDAMGGDFSGFSDLAMEAGGLYAINKTFGQAFASGGPQEAVGSQIGQAAGYATAGPFGAIVGGMFGAMAGDITNQLMGNADVDYDLKISQGSGGFEDDRYISTPFGNIGFNASSTRNLSMNKMGNPILGAYAQILGPIDQQLASVLNKDEMGQVRSKMEINIDNSHKYGPEYAMKLMLRDRMKTINSVMSDERKAETGWNDLLTAYNQQYQDQDRSLADQVREAQRKIDTYSAEESSFLGYRDERAEGEQEMAALMQQHPELDQLLSEANAESDNIWVSNDIGSVFDRYYDRIDEKNAVLRV